MSAVQINIYCLYVTIRMQHDRQNFSTITSSFKIKQARNNMTLDVTIGEITLEPNGLNVIQCPDAKHNICNPAYTICPKESYRSGSSGLWEFWRIYCGELYHIFREHPHSNDRDVAKLKPHIDKINALSNKCDDETSKDRMLWFKYWANKAVELYGDNAGIKFS